MSVAEAEASTEAATPAGDFEASAALPELPEAGGVSVTVDEPAAAAASPAVGSLSGAAGDTHADVAADPQIAVDADTATSAALADTAKRPSRRTFMSMSRKKKSGSDSAPLGPPVRPRAPARLV